MAVITSFHVEDGASASVLWGMPLVLVSVSSFKIPFTPLSHLLRSSQATLTVLPTSNTAGNKTDGNLHPCAHLLVEEAKGEN